MKRRKFNWVGTLLLLSIFDCTNAQVKIKPNEHIKIEYQLINLDGNKSDTLNFFNYIIHYDNYIIFKNPLYNYGVNDTKKNNSDTSYKYYVFKKNMATGIIIDSFNEKGYTTINRDSFIRSQMYAVFENATTLSRPIYAYAGQFNEGDIRIIKNGLKFQRDSSFSDTTLYYLDNKLKGLSFSINKYIDSVYQSKCFKIKNLYFNKIQGDKNFGAIYRQFNIMFNDENNNINHEEVRRVIETFKKHPPENSLIKSN